MQLPSILTLALTILPVLAAAAAAEDKLQIGVKKAIPDSECPRRTQSGDKLQMHYTGFLKSTGEKFDSSHDRNQEFEFTLGAGMVIKGWDQGLLDMCIGEQRKLTIPASLGYGERGAGQKIPGGATLVFDVELVGIKGYTPPEMPDLAGKAEL